MRDTPALTTPDQALLRLLQVLDDRGYDFTTVTPLTHARVLGRDGDRPGRDLRDALGWSRPFARDAVGEEVFELLQAAGALQACGANWNTVLRVSRLHDALYLHSAYPTTEEDSVFLGPDSYRFADFIRVELAGDAELGTVADIGGGAGVGALVAAQGRHVERLVLTDVNPRALRLARINAAHAGVAMQAVQAADLEGAPAECDVILANPPYIVDEAGRAYRDGGDLHGAEISIEWAKAAIPKLKAGGRFLLYTGSAILDGGRDRLREELETVAGAAGATLAYRELDPDVFGEELDKPPYADVERIAVIGATITKPR